MDRLSVIVPCYNEKDNLNEIFLKFSNIASKNHNIEIILVDNGSTDGSDEIFEKLLERSEKNLRFIRIPTNLGYGHGILKGLEVASGDLLSWTHADLQADPGDVITAFEFYISERKKNYDFDFLVKGERRKRNLIDSMFTLGMQLTTLLILRVNISDINAQPKLFSRGFYDNYFKKNAPMDFSLDLHLLYTAKIRNIPIKTFSVFFKNRIHGEAKGGGSFKGKLRLIKRTNFYIRDTSNKRYEK